jgi:mono/diheme cytochrome c family protein
MIQGAGHLITHNSLHKEFTMKKTLLTITLLLFVLSILAACGGGGSEPAPAARPAVQQPAAQPVSQGDPAKGKEAFATCGGCHGMDAKGIAGLGKDMTTSDFIKNQTDEELLAFLKVGRPASDPLNTVGVDMPPKGGNPALTDAQLLDIIAYMRSLPQ